jgi:hypothetical protein
MLWLLLLLSSDPQQPKPDWRVIQWPRDLASIPCAAWYRDGLGAYAVKGVIEWDWGDTRLINPHFWPESPEGRVIEDKCGPISRQ